MNRPSLTIAAMTFILTCLFAACTSTRSDLKQISAANDPSTLVLESAYNSYVRCTSLKDGTETGIIQFRDGSAAKYWFRSHHLTGDAGGTWFLTSDGTKLFMAGWFCCEVQLPEQQMESLAALSEFIGKHDGIHP
jgi:hypothetical protein